MRHPMSVFFIDIIDTIGTYLLRVVRVRFRKQNEPPREDFPDRSLTTPYAQSGRYPWFGTTLHHQHREVNLKTSDSCGKSLFRPLTGLLSSGLKQNRSSQGRG